MDIDRMHGGGAQWFHFLVIKGLYFHIHPTLKN